jgi:hypothetical protein
LITNIKPARFKIVRTNLYTDGVKLATANGDFQKRQMGINAKATIQNIFAATKVHVMAQPGEVF